MGLSNFVKNAIKVVGSVSKVSVEIGTQAIGAIAEKLDDNPKSKERIVNYGKSLGKTIKENTYALAENSEVKINEATKRYYEKQNSNKVEDNVYQYTVKFDKEKSKDEIQNDNVYQYTVKFDKEKSKDEIQNDNVYQYTVKFDKEKSEDTTQKDNQYIPEKICTKIVGVTVENRQFAVRLLTLGETVNLIREPNNQYDKEAIAIYNGRSEMLGYIPKDIESDLAKAMDNGIVYKANVTSKNGGNGLSYGAIIQVTKVNIDTCTNNPSNIYQPDKCETEDNEDIPEAICTKIVGVTFENRQPTVQKLKVGENIKLIRNPNNQYDKNAIEVFNENSEMLGHISKDNNVRLAKAMDNGIAYKASVISKIGGNGLSYGAVIQVTKVNIDSYTENFNNSYQPKDTEHRNSVTENFTSAILAFTTGDFEGTFQLLKNQDRSRPKVLSMLGASCYYTARFEESYEVYNRLFTGSIYTYELQCSLKEYDALGESLYNNLKDMKIYEFNLQDNLNNNYRQSIERADEQYPELDEFRDLATSNGIKFKEFLSRVEKDTKSSDTEIRGWASFNAAEVYFRTGKYDEAFSYYVDAISSAPSKALYYGYAAQALMRTQNPTYVMALYSRRAVDLDPQNARWHMLQGITFIRLSKSYDKLFLNTAKVELEKALQCCRLEQVSLKKSIEDLM